MENKNLREGNDYGGLTLSFGQECVLNLGECKVKVKEGVNFHSFKKDHIIQTSEYVSVC